MKKILTSLLALAVASAAYATPFTETSPTAGGALPVGVTKVGGIVFDARGVNGSGLVAQLSASSLFAGFAPGDPLVIGTQTGLVPGLLAQLGGGFSELAIRVTLFDGDTAAGNFDFNQNTFFVNGISLGNWSSVNAQRTDNSGTVAGTFSGGGFRDQVLDTGWFYVSNATTLANLYTSILGSSSAIYSLSDVDPRDNEYDFTRGVASGLINSETAPVVTSNVPDGGSTVVLMGACLLGLAALRRRRSA